MESKFGLMGPVMKGTGKKIKLMAKGPFGMLMGMFTQESGKMIGLTDTEYINMRMELNMKVTGKTICNMAMEWSTGSMVLSTLGTTTKGKSKVKASTVGEMVLFIKDSGTIIE